MNEGYDYRRIQTAFAFKMVMFTGKPGPVLPETALSSLKEVRRQQQAYFQETHEQLSTPEVPDLVTLKEERETVLKYISEGPKHVTFGREGWNEVLESSSENIKARQKEVIKSDTDAAFLTPVVVIAPLRRDSFTITKKQSALTKTTATAFWAMVALTSSVKNVSRMPNFSGK